MNLFIVGFLWGGGGEGAGADPGEVKWVNFHPPPRFFEVPSFFSFFPIPQILK